MIAAPRMAPALRWFHTAPINAEPAAIINAAINCARSGSRPKEISTVTRFPMTGVLKSSKPAKSEMSKGKSTWNSSEPYCNRYFLREEKKDTFILPTLKEVQQQLLRFIKTDEHVIKQGLFSAAPAW